MMISDAAYAQHALFAEIEQIIDFYESFADGVFQFATMGTTAIANIDTYVYSAMAGTLRSTRDVIRAGRINDGYALLRRFYDCAIINTYSNLYLKDHFSTVAPTPESLIVRHVNDWLHGKQRLPEYRVISNYVRTSARLAEINRLLYRDVRYKSIRDRCNDHMHYNFFNHVMLNNGEVYLAQRVSVIDQVMRDLRDIFALHLAYIFTVNDHYMMSSDHMDYLECGQTPPDGSQYWVAPYVQKVFDSFLSADRPDLSEAVKAGTKMQLV